MAKLLKYFPLVKVDEATHTVYGLATAEVPDKEGEICDYPFAKKQFAKWSAEASNSTEAAGQDVSYGNIRLMHQIAIAGKATAPPECRDDEKQIWLATQPANDDTWKLAKGGFLRGFSVGGDYAWRKCNVCKTDIPEAEDGSRTNHCPTCKKAVPVRFGPVISEVSYVDNPCLKAATFSMVKADGSTELRKFADTEGTQMEQPEIKIDTAAIVKAVIEGLRKSEATAKPTPGEFKETIEAAAKAHALAALEKAANTRGLAKDMYDVSRFASIMSDLSYLQASSRSEADWEGDNSTLPADLAEDLASLAESFIAMAEEETEELKARAAGKGAKKSMDATKLAKAARKSVADHLANMKAAHMDHCDKMCKMHKAQADAMSSMCDKMSKIVGTEEADEIDGKDVDMQPANIDVAAAGTENTYGKGKEASFTKADFEAAVSKSTETILQQVLKAIGGDTRERVIVTKADGTAIEMYLDGDQLTKAESADSKNDDDEEDADKKKKAAKGIGERGNPILQNGGPMIKVMPVTKTQDTGAPQIAASAPTQELAKRALAGDTAAQLEFMKSATPGEIPAHVAQALSSVRK